MQNSAAPIIVGEGNTLPPTEPDHFTNPKCPAPHPSPPRHPNPPPLSRIPPPTYTKPPPPKRHPLERRAPPPSKRTQPPPPPEMHPSRAWSASKLGSMINNPFMFTLRGLLPIHGP